MIQIISLKKRNYKIHRPKVEDLKNNVNAIEIKNLCKRYGKNDVLKSLSLTIPKGKNSILLGNNGCGKSTLMNCILGYTGINDGEIVLRVSRKTKAISSKSFVSYAPQYDPLYYSLGIKDHIHIFGKLKGLTEKKIKSEIVRIMKLVDLKKSNNNPIGSFSGGMKRKITLSLAFLGNPSIIFLDEPTSSIDPVARQQIWNMINSLQNSESSIIICTHTPKEADILGSYFLIMNDGKISDSGTRDEILNKCNLSEKLQLFTQNDATQKQKDDLRDTLNSINEISCIIDSDLEFEYKINSLEVLKNSQFKDALQSSKIIENISIKEPSSADIFLNYVKPSSEAEITGTSELIIDENKTNCCKLFSAQSLSQLSKLWHHYFSIKQIFLTNIMIIAMLLVIYTLIYLNSKNFFELDQKDYVTQLVPGILLNKQINKLDNFTTFYSYDQNNENEDKVVKFFKLLQDNNETNIHCLENKFILENNSHNCYNDNRETSQANIYEFETWKNKNIIGGFSLSRSESGKNLLTISYTKHQYKNGAIMLNQYHNLLAKSQNSTATILTEAEVFEKTERSYLSEKILKMIISETKLGGKIGYCPQYPAFLPDLTVKQHLEVIYGIRGLLDKSIKNKAVEMCLKQYNCVNISHKFPENMSGGEKKRLALAMANPASIKPPEVFMFDEAIAALDISTQELVRNFMKNIVNVQEKGILFSTH
ncbi:MAG: hypothetical protein MHPSP_000557 [Paramarteilia canceri]